MAISMDFLTSEIHPLKAEIEKVHLRLWQLSKATGLSDSTLCRMLNGLVPMPEKIESKIREILDEIKQPLVNCK